MNQSASSVHDVFEPGNKDDETDGHHQALQHGSQSL